MLKVIYTKYGDRYTDFDLLEMAKVLIDDYKSHMKEVIYVSTSNIIIALRVLVKRGTIKHTDIIFEFNGEIITINSYGKMSHYPDGFIDWNELFLDELLDSNYEGEVKKSD
jgi:hypothetical protein